MTTANLRVDRDGALATLTITRPEKLNALDGDVLTELQKALLDLGRDASLRAVVLTGEGKAFVAGADISAMQSMSPSEAEAFSQLGHSTFALIETLHAPVIAAVNGFALGGGCELALACDFIYASERAKFGQPEVKLGVIPGFGGTQRLARRVGIAKARELVYTGAIIDANEALRIGLANAVYAPDELLAKATATAKAIADMSPNAVRIAKKVLLDGEERSLAEANALEVTAFANCFEHAEQKEGMAAFLEKRTPKF
jgi:enoyl-CoA hydratase